MGRYYYGDIAGKFWFACQSSYDAENIGGIVSVGRMVYMICNCEYEHSAHKYCHICYDSYEEHLKDLREDDFITKDNIPGDNQPLIWKNSEVDCYFDEGSLEIVEEHIKTLYEKIGHLIEDFTMENEENSYEYDIDWNEEYLDIDTKKEEELVARYCLARQVAQCIKDKGECHFYGEF